jgi:hypothetical protein
MLEVQRKLEPHILKKKSFFFTYDFQHTSRTTFNVNKFITEIISITFHIEIHIIFMS